MADPLVINTVDDLVAAIGTLRAAAADTATKVVQAKADADAVAAAQQTATVSQQAAADADALEQSYVAQIEAAIPALFQKQT